MSVLASTGYMDSTMSVSQKCRPSACLSPPLSMSTGYTLPVPFVLHFKAAGYLLNMLFESCPLEFVLHGLDIWSESAQLWQ